MLNRGAIIVRPAKPFLEWASKLDDSGLLPDVDGEQTVYLIPEFEDEREFEQSLSNCYSEIFEDQLLGWHTDPSAWPEVRDLTVFLRWFSIEIHSVVEDLCGYEFTDDSEWEE